MECPDCGIGVGMIIDEWGGWVWTCAHCDYVGRSATDKEISDFEEWKRHYFSNKVKGK